MGRLLRITFIGIVFVVVSGWFSGCATGRYTPTKPQASHRKGFFDRLAGGGGKKGVGAAVLASREAGAAGESSSDDWSEEKAQEVDLVLKKVSFQWPLKSTQVTSHFGNRGPHFHEGVDLRASRGTPVFAVQSGKVLYSGAGIRGYGKMIVIRHQTQIASIYAHNSKLIVRRGQVVKKGQRIALSGNTGRSSGPHLHFEIRRGVAAVNPLLYLPVKKVPGTFLRPTASLVSR